MSSHYHIRDYQEPALVIIDLNACEKSIIFNLLEWQPSIISYSDQLELLELNDIKPDLIFNNGSGEISNYFSDYKVLPAKSRLVENLSHLEEVTSQGINILADINSVEIVSLKENPPDYSVVVYSGNVRYALITVKNYSKWAHPNHGFILPDASDALKNLFPIDETQNHFKCKYEGKIEFEASPPFWMGEILR